MVTEIERKALTVALVALLAGCSSEELAKNERLRKKLAAEQEYSDNYQECINRVTGFFSSASAEVMRECARLAKEGKSA